MSKALKKLIDINRLREFKNKLVGAGSAYVQTTAVDQTIAGTKTFSKPIVGSVTGNAATATKATQDAAGNTITTTYATKAENNTKANNSEVVHKSGDETIAGTKTFTSTIVGNVTGNASTAANATYANWLRTASHPDYLFLTEWDGAYFWTYVKDPAGSYVAVRVARSDSAATAEACTGNAATATKATQDAAGNTITTTYATKAENNTKANNSEVVHKSGDETIAGTKTFNDTVHANGVLSTSVSAFMSQYGGYTLVIRNDGSDTYLLMSDKNGAPGTWSNARPLVIHNSTGVCNINGNAATATKAANANHATKADSATNANHATKADSATNANHATNADSATKATSADRASAANCVISNTDAPHEIRLDWDSQVSGFVGLRVDAVNMGGIVTTNNIRAQWYAAYPDGAEAHNAMWGGRDITAAFNNGTVSANIANGTFKDIFPGDYIMKQVTIPRAFADDGVTVIFDGGTYTVNWVIADCDYWINKGDTATTAHHVVIVPQAPIFDARMNPTNKTTDGGYAGSDMYRKIILACARGIVHAFGSSHILTFRDGITNSVDISYVSSGIPQYVGTPDWWGEWVSVQCNLMSEKMVYGAPICAAGAMDNTMATRQMSAFRLSEKLINYNRSIWWLRDVVSSAHFAVVNGNGVAYANFASDVRGVRPFALLI